MAALELAVRIPAGRETEAAAELAACTPAATRAILRQFAAALLARLETAENSILVLDLPAEMVARIAQEAGTPARPAG